jgi:indole-3-glycerol phosphate synthase
MTVLERILAETRTELERRKRELPLEQLREAAIADAGAPRAAHRFRDALNAERIGVIAEFKRRSPSAGTLRESPDLAEVVGAYERGGAVAVSILTEGPNFAGALAAGADAVLLIVAALAQPALVSLHDAAQAIGLDTLVEVHDREELHRALDAGAQTVGVNNRDLRDFSVEVERTEALMDDVPPGVTVVSESGIARAEQVRRLRERGVQAVLVGESLMRATDPAAALRELVAERPDAHLTAP